MRPYKKPLRFTVYGTTKTSMIFTFDPAKDAVNRARHGNLSLAFGAKVFEDDRHVVLPSIRPIDGEDRYKVVGQIDGKLFTAVHVVRDGIVRFISVRRSNDGEERSYHRP